MRITRRSVGTGLLPDRGSWQDTANLSDERGYNRGNFHVLLRKIRTTKPAGRLRTKGRIKSPARFHVCPKDILTVPKSGKTSRRFHEWLFP